MPDWTKTMQQTFEYYVVDPGTWKDAKRLSNVISSTINRDAETETLGSLTLDVAELIGECYVRIYLVTIQNDIKEKIPLGTYLIQTPSYDFDGKVKSVKLDAYTPLMELKEKRPPIGYSLLENENIMERAYQIARDNLRAPVFRVENSEVLHFDFVSNTNDSWVTFLSDLISNAKYSLGLDELGKVIFMPIQDTASLQPVWRYNDDNSSILQPKVEMSQDLYGIPNVVEVIYSSNKNYFYSKVVNDDPNSPISTVNRGREISYREMNPTSIGNPSQEQLDEYAKRLLRSLSSLEYRVTYTHAYCPVRIGDCVMLNYARAGLNNVKAKVVSQKIECRPGCPVTETVVFTNRLWGD